MVWMARSRWTSLRNMNDQVQRGDIRIVGSAHSGLRGDFRPTLFQATRAPRPVWDGDWDISTIDIDGPGEEIRIMGLALGPAGLLAVAGSKERSCLATFDANLRQTGWHELPGVIDPHGLAFEDDRIWVVSSGTNEVIRFDIGPTGPSNATRVYKYSDEQPQHFNGIARHSGRLILSAFGVAAAAAREVSNTGYLIDVEGGVEMRAGLDQPHSLVSHDGSLFFCESKPSLIWCDVGEPLALNGYLRGLAIAPDDVVHVAACQPRPPRETLTADRGDAELWSLTRDGTVLGRCHLTTMGAEVYDLIVLPCGGSGRAALP